jgi:ribosomal protein S18 acetylase RimI-like enzyme
MSIVREPYATTEPRIRRATAADVAAVTQIVAEAYRHYIPRMGRTPAPMLDDYAVRVSEGCVWVVEEDSAVRGVAVLLPKQDHMLLENIAVDPMYQDAGYGRQLLVFAETEAVGRGYSEIRLYTHKTMTENQRLYAKIGYLETNRGTEASYDRLYMHKQLNVGDARQ